MLKRINIAIDGYAGSGKSTLARLLADSLEYRFVDTGALYRAATLVILDKEYKIENQPALADLLLNAGIGFSSENSRVTIRGKEVEKEIRSQRVADRVSQVAALPVVRESLLDIQRQFIEQKAVVMEGRDIGSVIMPEAELKLFITARFEVRAQRRRKQMATDSEQPDIEKVRENLRMRDQVDCTREQAPLSVPGGAVIIDNSDISLDELHRFCLSLARPLTDPSLLPHLSAD